MINLLIKTTESPRDDDSLNLKEGQLHSLVEAVSEQGVTLEHQGNIIIGLNENYHKFLAAIAGTVVGGSNRALHGLGNLL